MGSIDTPEPKISLTQHQKLKYDHTQTVNEKKKNLALTAAGTAILTQNTTNAPCCQNPKIFVFGSFI